jgi:hypothetical protein
VATSPVRIGDEEKLQLERLRREVTAATGERPSQQEVLGDAIGFALRHRDQFLIEAAWRPLTDEEIRAWEQAARKERGWKAVRAEDIDDVVYGEP